MRKTLTFHSRDTGNDARLGATYYIERDYKPVAVRIHAEKAPVIDAKVDIFADDVSIFNNRTPSTGNTTTWDGTVNAPLTAAVLGEGENTEEHADDFKQGVIEEGSWVYCTLVDSGSGKNFSVHLELEILQDLDEGEA